MRKRLPSQRLSRLIQGICALIFGCFGVQAEIHTDGTLGPAQRLQGPDFQIPENLGSRAGANLFHSFRTFDVYQGESATFTGSADIANVVSRVTGGEGSSIDGVLRSEIGTADFYFINPGGVTFGPNAKVDVPASFHVSTADELKFSDGQAFSANDPEASSLSIARPEAFGFGGGRSARITVDRSELVMAPTSTLNLVGGDLKLQGAEVNSEAGEVRLVAMGGAAGLAPLQESMPSSTDGALTVDSSSIDVSGDGGGQVVIRAGTTHISDSLVYADNQGAKDATRGIDVISGSLVLDSGSLLTSDTVGRGDSGPISVSVDGDLDVLDGSEIHSATGGEGDAGALRMQAANLRILDGGSIASITLSEGNAGAVDVEAARLVIDRQGSESSTGIVSASARGSSGKAGAIRVIALDKLEILGGGQIATSTFGEGDAGKVAVAAGDVVIDGRGNSTAISSVAASGSSGNAGAVQVEATSNLDIIDGGAIISGTSGEGDAGKVDIEVKKHLRLINRASVSSVTFGEGDAGTVSVNAEQLTADGRTSQSFTGIASRAGSGSEGNAGDIQVGVEKQLTLLSGALISSGTFATGNAGTISVTAGQLRVDRQGSKLATGITSQANADSTGNAGKVQVEVEGQMDLVNGAQVSSSTFAKGNAGRVLVKAGRLALDRQGSEFFTGISSQANPDSTGDAGVVQVDVEDQLKLANGALISSNTFAAGNAGTVKVTAGQLTVDGQGSEFLTGIASRANPGSQGSTGDVVIKAGQLRLLNRGQISIEAGNTLREENLAEIDSGRIRIDAQDIELSEGALITAKSTGNVPAAAIDITARRGMKVTGSSRVTTEATRADGGPIEITGGSILLQNGLITTSAEEKGDGGDIRIRSDALIMDTGFIQANTGAPGASGGDILVDTPQLVVTFGRLEVGGEQRQVFEPDSGLNVIQAAAPDGVSGNVQVTTPEVDVTGALFAMETGFGGVAAVGENPCKVAPGAQPSSLTRGGHGGVPAGASETLSLPWARRIERHTDGKRSGGWFPGAATDIGDSDRQAGRRDPRCR